MSEEGLTILLANYRLAPYRSREDCPLPNPPDLHSLTDEQHARLAHHVMRRQAALSLQVASVFLAMLFGLPLLNHFAPEFANRNLFGFTLTWFLLGVLFYPITWLLSAYFVRQSDRIEAECSDWRAVLGEEAGEPLEPEGLGEVHPAFIETDLPESHEEMSLADLEAEVAYSAGSATEASNESEMSGLPESSELSEPSEEAPEETRP